MEARKQALIDESDRCVINIRGQKIGKYKRTNSTWLMEIFGNFGKCIWWINEHRPINDR